MIKFFHNVTLFLVKNANFFAEVFGENILKIITSIPGTWKHFYSSLCAGVCMYVYKLTSVWVQIHM
jgi:hypothetical protein